MNKTNTIIVKIIPIISAIIFFTLVFSPYHSNLIKNIITLTCLLAFSGFIFCFINGKLKDKTIKILNILDIMATIFIIVFYILAIFSFGL